MAMIPLTQGRVAIVDDADYAWLIQHRWCFHGDRYAARKYRINGGQIGVLMHRAIVDAPLGLEVDHIDGDGLNNQRNNLRLATHSENQANRPGSTTGSSRFKGVSWEQRRGIWRAQIQVHGERIKLGTFRDEVEAARAYDAAALMYFGSFAFINFGDTSLCK